MAVRIKKYLALQTFSPFLAMKYPPAKAPRNNPPHRICQMLGMRVLRYLPQAGNRAL